MFEFPHGAAIPPHWKRAAKVGLVLLIGTGTAFLLQRGVDALREDARLTECRSNLKQLLLAFHNYHDSYGSFPPAYTTDAEGKPVHSWRVLLRPYLESSDFYWHYRLDEAWDSTHNRHLAEEYRAMAMDCPSADHPEGPLLANYVVVVGPGTAFPGGKSTSLADITDGPENTILVVETMHSNVLWSEPRDLRTDEMSFRINDPNHPSISSAHRGVVNVGFADGTVQRLDASTNPETVRALLTIAGGEPVSKTTVGESIHFPVSDVSTQ